MSLVEGADWPEYCCAILKDSRGWYLMERRPATAKKAAGLLTSFGGMREPGEEPEACVRRELKEELGFEAENLEMCLRLMGKRDGLERRLAWFFRGMGPEEGDRLVVEPGREAVWIEPGRIGGPDVSHGHRAAMEGERVGMKVVRVDA